MKTLSIIVSVLFSTISIFAQDRLESPSPIVEEELCTLTVEFVGLDSDKGMLKIGLYDSEQSWLRQRYMSKETKPVDGKASVTFEGIPYGIYAISTYHDENHNSKLDTGIFGIPTEPYASSRGAKGRFGPPKWKKAKFELNTNTQTEIIKY